MTSHDQEGQGRDPIQLRLNIWTTVETAAVGQIPRFTERIFDAEVICGGEEIIGGTDVYDRPFTFKR